MAYEQQAMNGTPDYLEIGGRRIAYIKTPGAAPGVIFLGGLHSDMEGTKALYLEEWCTGHGQAFLRFDYTGHGKSSGDFADGCIGAWAADAIDVIDQVASGPQILVGSSMGGWIALLVAKARPERVAGFVGIAAAPDFTEDLMWAGFDPDIKRMIEEDGVYFEPSDYDDEPYPITRKLIEDGRKHLVLREPLPINVPVRLIQGQCDPDVPWAHALKLAEHIESKNVELVLVKDGDHRLSRPRDLERLTGLVGSLLVQNGS